MSEYLCISFSLNYTNVLFLFFRKLNALKTLQEMTESFPHTNYQDEDAHSKLLKIRAKFKQVFYYYFFIMYLLSAVYISYFKSIVPFTLEIKTH